jgi:hypothetical protein
LPQSRKREAFCQRVVRVGGDNAPALGRAHTNHGIHIMTGKPVLPLLGGAGLGAVTGPGMAVRQMHGIPVEEQTVELVVGGVEKGLSSMQGGQRINRCR